MISDFEMHRRKGYLLKMKPLLANLPNTSLGIEYALLETWLRNHSAPLGLHSGHRADSTIPSLYIVLVERRIFAQD